jgi:hypothetical protein
MKARLRYAPFGVYHRQEVIWDDEPQPDQPIDLPLEIGKVRTGPALQNPSGERREVIDRAEDIG